jgi:DNA-binding NtrC family response regulator
MAKEKVLLVDDDPEFIEVLSQRMEARDVDVDTATSGPEAVEKVSGASYDAIILDLSMPGLDGMLTGYATLEKGIEAVKLGAMDFLEKPAEIQRLMEKIEKAKANKMLLVEEQNEERLKGILKSKSW